MSESSSAKIAVVVGIGAIVIGGLALRARYSPHPPPPEVIRPTPTVASTAPPTTTPTPSTAGSDRTGDPPKPAAENRGPTAEDRAALMDAISAGDLGKVEVLAGKGVSLEGTLDDAAKSGSAPLVQFLLAHGVAATEGEELTVPPLLLADDNDGIVNALLAKGAHEPPLAKAVQAGAPKAVARQLGKGGNANAKSAEGEPLLLVAVRDTGGAKRRVIIDALLKAGADPNARSDDESPLSLAVSRAARADSRGASDAGSDERAGERPIDVVARLVAAKAKVDGEELVAAQNAEESRRGPLLDALLGGTLDKNATLHAITYATNNHDAASIKRLAAKGVAWTPGEPNVTPPLVTAIVASDVATVRALLDAGAPTRKTSDDGDTALLAAIAAAAGDSEDAVRVVRALLEHGVSANERGKDGRTPLFAAAQQGSEALVALLVAKGARVDDPVDGRTPYEAADAHGYDAVTKILKARGAKVTKPVP